MSISDLQNQLRILVRRRIAAGEMSGTDLAHLAGFQQAHASNFLNGRRGLSIEAMDRVMDAMRLDMRDLLPEPRRKTAREGEVGSYRIPVVEPRALLQADFGTKEIMEYLWIQKSFLQRLRPEMETARENWHRFVLVKTDRESGMAMRPRLAPGALLLVDRHYNSLRSYRRHEPNLYVVKNGAEWRVRYAELQGTQLTLRPENPDWGLGYIRPGKGESFANYVVGRVAHIAMTC
jgi:transcriptional regulator with XRE-family HTH domain